MQVPKNAGYVPSLIVDVGAYQGTWTREAIDLFAGVKVVMIDPLPQNAIILQSMSRESGLLHYEQCAVDEECGEAILHVHADQSSLLEAREYGGETIVVSKRTLDSLLQPGSPPSGIFMKIDVQGAELRALQGAKETLKACEFVLLELSVRPIYENTPLADEIIKFMSNNKFSIFDICSYAQRPKDSNLCQIDVLFVRKGSSYLGGTGWR